MLNPVAENVWEAPAPFRFLGFKIGTRMTVVRLPDTSLLLHSPVAMDDALRGELDALGPVRHIVCPNLYHHLYAGTAQALYPAATLWAPGRLAKKRPELRIDRELGETPAAEWGASLELVTIRGSMLSETVLFHVPSRTLITADFIEYFERCDDPITRLYLRAGGVYRNVGWNRLLRFLYRDRAAARASIDRILQWDFERVTIAHGNVVTEDAKSAVAGSFSWL